MGKHRTEIANHRPGKLDMLTQHASMKLDMLSQQAKCRQAIPAHIANSIVYNGLLEPRTVDKPWESEEPDTGDKQREQIAVGIGDWQSNDNSILGS